MAERTRPENEAELCGIVASAARDGIALSIEGNGTKSKLGRPMETQAHISLARFSGITMYEPEELVFSARAGTPLRHVEETLAANNQRLAFEPGNWPTLWSGTNDQTIGGVVAANVAGPRRFHAGAPRDHVIGVKGVNGRGETFNAGGRVVKNVTGFDLPKLISGSFGTLCAMTEITLRALPIADDEVTLVYEGRDDADALALLRRVAQSPVEASGLAHRPQRAGTLAQSYIRLEGLSDGIPDRMRMIARFAGNPAHVWQRDQSRAHWRTLADVADMAGRDAPLWRLSLPPTAAHDAIVKLAPVRWFADWAGGLLWVETGESTTIQAMHEIAHKLGGHATLMRAPEETRLSSPVFAPRDDATLALVKRIKAAFDPARIFNPGRMYAGV